MLSRSWRSVWRPLHVLTDAPALVERWVGKRARADLSLAALYLLASLHRLLALSPLPGALEAFLDVSLLLHVLRPREETVLGVKPHDELAIVDALLLALWPLSENDSLEAVVLPALLLMSHHQCESVFDRGAHDRVPDVLRGRIAGVGGIDDEGLHPQ